MIKKLSAAALVFLISLTTIISVAAFAKTYTAKGWATHFTEEGISWCNSCGYEECNLHGDVNDFCPECQEEMKYRFVQTAEWENFKYDHVDYTVTVKKGKACKIKFPTKKRDRRAKLGRYQGYPVYDWASKVDKIKYVAKYSGNGKVLEFGGNKLTVKCKNTCRFLVAYKNHSVVALRVKVK